VWTKSHVHVIPSCMSRRASVAVPRLNWLIWCFGLLSSSNDQSSGAESHSRLLEVDFVHSVIDLALFMELYSFTREYLVEINSICLKNSVAQFQILENKGKILKVNICLQT